MSSASPFHEGEREVQTRLGVRDVEAWAGKAIRSELPDSHRAFHAGLPFLVVAARDARGRPWATLLAGPEGFVRSPDPRTLAIDARPCPGDALETSLVPGADVGALGIDLATRRRNRLNGRIVAGTAEALVVSVAQCFGNCPRYVRKRVWRRVAGGTPLPAKRGRRLDAGQRAWIAGADTCFIASGFRGAGEHPGYGMDASHRGGEPGFVRVRSAGHLVFPDHAGNNLFNTIGNLARDPRAGLLFVDFESGGLLQLTGSVQIDWDSDAVARVPGAQRLLHFAVEEILELPEALPLRWETQADPTA